MGAVEDIILRHGQRGMDVLREYCPPEFCQEAAECIFRARRGNVLLLTGFYIAGCGVGETDGPPGTLFLAKALAALGFSPVIVTDGHCRAFFDGEGVPVVCPGVDDGEDSYAALLDDYDPALLISIERCGENVRGDYANMRGVSIADHTAKADLLFPLAAKRGIPTIGVGDGGNEIGMGNLAEIISEKLSLVPCKVPADHLVIATVSNWGAYGLCAYLERLSGLALLPGFDAVMEYLNRIVTLGCVDGVTKTAAATVDGYSPEVKREVLDALRDAVDADI